MIKYYRWVPTLLVEVSRGINRNVFKDVIDHEDKTEELLKARELANSWLSNHYGYCVISIGDLVIRLDNKQKMKKELKELGFYIKL